jgi:hypothetical protein
MLCIKNEQFIKVGVMKGLSDFTFVINRFDQLLDILTEIKARKKVLDILTAEDCAVLLEVQTKLNHLLNSLKANQF